MVLFAANVGFSPALGAFIMGSIIAETTQAEHIEHLVKPVKDLFGAVFFVSVGMLIDPEMLVKYAIPVGILTFVVIIGQSFLSTVGTLLSGQPLKQSVQTGMSLSQIGEFSFIIATLGITLKVTSDFLYPIIVAVSAITTFTTPFMVKLSTPFSDYLVKHLPKRWTKRIERYSANTQAIRSESNWRIVLRAYLVQVIIHSTIIVSIILISSNYLIPMLPESKFAHIIVAFITLIIISPFLYALSLRRVAIVQVNELLKERKYRGPIIMMVFLRALLTLVFLGFFLNVFFSPVIAFIALIICLVVFWLFPKKLTARYYKIEERFIKNLNSRELAKAKRSRSDLTPWDGHMATFEIARESNISGKTLEELKLRENLGINVAYIKRGDIIINIPSKNERIFPADEIGVIGTDNQVKELKIFLDQNEAEEKPDYKEPDIVLRQINLKNQSYIGKSIRESNLREKTSGLVVGIERNGNRFLNPESTLILLDGDILWIVGNKKLLNELTHN
jgi:CPA2 family monovalent cation:H+ antiporter-2